jgi:hypothetical protein
MYPKRKESPRFQALLIFCVHSSYQQTLHMIAAANSHAKVPSPCKQVRTLCACTGERERETHTDRTERKRGEGVKKHSILSCMHGPFANSSIHDNLDMSNITVHEFFFFFSSFLGYLELRKL